MKKIIPLCVAVMLSVQVIAQDRKTSVLEELENGQGQMQKQTQQQNQTATLKSSARLFGAKDDLTTVITIIPSGSTVTVLESDSTYYRVAFEEDEGYILKRQAVLDKTPKPVTNVNNATQDQDNRVQPQAQNDNQDVQQNQPSRFSYLEDKYGTSMAARINSGKIWKGMTPEMVKDSWGTPQKIKRVINGNTMKEEWTYANTILSFSDNSLVEWGPARK